MTTSQIASVWTEFDESKQLSLRTLGYFRGRLGNKFYQLVLEQFEKRKLEGFTKAKLARRIHKRPEQITRLFNAPGNWTIDTASDILLGLGFEASISLVEVKSQSISQPAKIEVRSLHDFDAANDADRQGISAQKPISQSGQNPLSQMI